jgi:hypothetical protein
MTARTKKGLKLAAAAIFAALLVAITVNAAVDYWTPQADVKDPAMPAAVPAVELAPLQVPLQPLPVVPLNEEAAATPGQPWNQPLFEPKFDAPGAARSAPQGGAQGFTAPDFSHALNQFAPLSEVLPPSISAPGTDPTGISIRPIFNSKAGGVESGALGAAGSLPGTAGNAVGGATSGASSLLKR